VSNRFSSCLGGHRDARAANGALARVNDGSDFTRERERVTCLSARWWDVARNKESTFGAIGGIDYGRADARPGTMGVDRRLSQYRGLVIRHRKANSSEDELSQISTCILTLFAGESVLLLCGLVFGIVNGDARGFHLGAGPRPSTLPRLRAEFLVGLHYRIRAGGSAGPLAIIQGSRRVNWRHPCFRSSLRLCLPARERYCRESAAPDVLAALDLSPGSLSAPQQPDAECRCPAASPGCPPGRRSVTDITTQATPVA